MRKIRDRKPSPQDHTSTEARDTSRVLFLSSANPTPTPFSVQSRRPPRQIPTAPIPPPNSTHLSLSDLVKRKRPLPALLT